VTAVVPCAATAIPRISRDHYAGQPLPQRELMWLAKLPLYFGAEATDICDEGSYLSRSSLLGNNFARERCGRLSGTGSWAADQAVLRDAVTHTVPSDADPIGDYELER
jgi:hypothetical protein